MQRFVSRLDVRRFVQELACRLHSISDGQAQRTLQYMRAAKSSSTDTAKTRRSCLWTGQGGGLGQVSGCQIQTEFFGLSLNRLCRLRAAAVRRVMVSYDHVGSRDTSERRDTDLGERVQSYREVLRVYLSLTLTSEA
nr:hypothetical protein CFP56_53269 [Quercus suber]